MTYVLLSAALLQLAGCDSKSKSDGGDKSSTSEADKPKKSLDQREDELYSEFLKIAGKNKSDCAKMGEEAKALVKKESATVDEINAAFDKMSPDEKEKKKKSAQERNNKNKDFMNAFICGIDNKDVSAAADKIVPSTK